MYLALFRTSASVCMTNNKHLIPSMYYMKCLTFMPESDVVAICEPESRPIGRHFGDCDPGMVGSSFVGKYSDQ